MIDEKVDEVFNNFIENCSEKDLDFIVVNEVSIEEKIKILKEKNSEVKLNILENFDVKVEGN